MSKQRTTRSQLKKREREAEASETSMMTPTPPSATCRNQGSRSNHTNTSYGNLLNPTLSQVTQGDGVNVNTIGVKMNVDIFSLSSSDDSDEKTKVVANANDDNSGNKPKSHSTLQAATEQIQLIANMEPCQCGFCYVNMRVGEGVMLNSCLHAFCKDCLTSSIELQTAVQIKCPLNNDHSVMGGCDGVLLDKEVKALVSEDLYQKYLDRSVMMAKRSFNVFQCKTQQCNGFCEFEPGRRTFDCYLCLKTNCLGCNVIHDGIDCNVYKKLAASGKSPNEITELINKERRNGWEMLKGLVGQQNGNMADVYVANYLVTTMEFDCGICMTEVPAGDGVIVQECLHTFCRDCLRGLIEAADESEIKCPYIDENYSCTNFLKPREIKALATPEVYEKYLVKSMKVAESAMANSYHCKTLDCPGWCEFENAENANELFFNCDVCQKQNCLKCQAIHEGTSCEDYKNRIVQNENDKLTEKKLAKMIASGECMKCPKCHSIVQKLIGCDWLVCFACKTELCWATKGPRWGPKGHGDTSGGCKCDFKNGRKCTPKCQNCH